MNEQRYWQAFERRDATMDGVFVIAVTSTKIYCRPSCPARRPKRENVRFFALNREAEAAGFRACKRCKPDQLSAEQVRDALVERVCGLIDDSLARDEPSPSLDRLASTVGQSKFHLQRVFKERMGLSPKQYARERADGRLRSELLGGQGVLQSAQAAGYESTAGFYERACRVLGMQPGDYRQRGRGQKMWYAFGETFLGPIVLAGTERGISALRFGDDHASLLRELHGLFARAELIEASDVFAEELGKAVARIEWPDRLDELPLDIQGTVFQKKVWDALGQVVAGQTKSYGDIAHMIGRPEAVRAVANACGANPVAVIVPCHRILRGDGSLGGYRWGPDRKRQLLAREGVVTG